MRLVGMRYLHRPLPDGRRVPEPQVQAIVKELTAYLQQGKRLLIHCEGGRNRSGLIAALLLVQTGTAPAEAVALVRAGRKGALANTVFANYITNPTHSVVQPEMFAGG